jgi:two-component system NtrC family response regulator
LETRPTRRSVLLIDDEALFLEVMVKVLGRHGITAHSATDGLVGIELMTRVHPDAVVLDLKMPGEGGLEVLRKIKELDPLIPVIILTGHGTVQAGIEAMDLKAFDFQMKPVAVDKLIEAIEEAIQSRDLVQEASKRGG